MYPTEDDKYEDDEYWAVAYKHYGKYSSLSCCQTHTVLKAALSKVIQSAKANGASPDSISYLIKELVQFVEWQQSVLNPLAISPDGSLEQIEYSRRLSDKLKKEDPITWIWIHRNPIIGVEEGETSWHYWPISETIDEICDEYIRKPWLQCGAIDRILVDALIYRETFCFSLALQTNTTLLVSAGLSSGLFASLFGYKKGRLFDSLKAFLTTTFRLGLSAVLGFAAAEAHDWWLGILVGVGFWVLLKINLYLSNAERASYLKYVRSCLAEMQACSEMMQKYPLSPKYLRERLSASADKGVVWPVGVFPILDCAIQRNPNTWD
ncbi:MAG: hypothetical protein FIA97_03710 [Methylococcaceae bacterium]|nr:hypothetical protein [Methylococcaceae bacterium]